MTEVTVTDDGGHTLRMLAIGGFNHPLFSSPAEQTKAVFENVPNFECRDDDVMLCSYPKTGTHWLHEILHMILLRKAERVEVQKSTVMLEAVPQEVVNQTPSPRVINCHYPPSLLPKSLATKQIKTVLVLRNPKDVAVSMYNMTRSSRISGYTGEFHNYIRPFLRGKFPYGSYSDYLNTWQDFIEKGPEYPLHLVYYEDMKLNCLAEVDRLCKFLDVDLDDQLKSDIVNMCSFDVMAKYNERFAAKLRVYFRDGFSFYRKGQVGDWKNWLTVAKDEMFDAMWKEGIRNDTMFNFKYTLP